MAKQNVGEMLLEAGLITEQQLKEALKEQQYSGERLGAVLIKLDMISGQQLIQFLSEKFKISVVDPTKLSISKDVVDLMPLNLVKKYQAFPFGLVQGVLQVAVADPSNIPIADDLRFQTKHNVRVHLASDITLQLVIQRYHGSTDGPSPLDEVMKEIGDAGELDLVETQDEQVPIASLEDVTGQAPAVKLVNYFLMEAIQRRASDIHIECYERNMRVRFRIDGLLYEIMKPPYQIKNAIISRLKIMSRLDIAERRLPQDGRIKLSARGKEMDFRVSVLPTLFGEKVVLRLLDKSSLQLDMTKLGFEEDQLKAFRDAIYKPYGIVLVTGPTGSGKTTTLYSALSDLNRSDTNISTAEDPVEFNLEGINQLQVHEAIGLTFAAALRSFLRQDPDIIMVGEVRDFETAEIAIKAALTGHLVLSTLHTNDAPSTVNRLLNMGIESFLVSSSLNAVVAQRLARRVCTECRIDDEVPPEVLFDLGFNENELGTFIPQRGLGCPACNDTGYRGRVALYEMMPMHEELRDLVLVGASAAEIKKEAIRLGMLTLRRSGLNKIKQGITTIEEVIRNSVSD
jgi:type IV pilus assembly protein PilB